MKITASFKPPADFDAVAHLEMRISEFTDAIAKMTAAAVAPSVIERNQHFLVSLERERDERKGEK